MKVLITGATGFVGSWLTREMLNLGHEVRVLSRSGKANFEFPADNIEICKGDINDFEAVKNATKGVDSVFHLAGVVGYSKKMLPEMIRANVDGTRCIVNASIANNIKRFVHMSSVTAVGASFDGKKPLNEESPFNVAHLHLGYFDTKLAAEKIVKQAFLDKKLDVVIVNPSTIYGPGDATKGSRKTQLKVARGEMPFYTDGGVSVIHVGDLISGVLAAWQKGRSGERYILSGDNITIKELFETIASCAGVSAPTQKMPNLVLSGLGWLGDCLANVGLKGPISSENAWTARLFHWFDNSKAKNELGLTTKSARIAIQESVDWSRKHGLLEKK
jgi:dihydroflavonol-4-reductase